VRAYPSMRDLPLINRWIEAKAASLIAGHHLRTENQAPR